MATYRDVLEAISDVEMLVERMEPQGLREQLRAMLNAMRRAISLRFGG